MEEKQKTETLDDEIDLFEMLEILWKGKILVLAGGAVVVAAVLLYLFFQPVTYTVQGRLRVGKVADISLETFESLKTYCTSDQIEGELQTKLTIQLENDRYSDDLGVNVKYIPVNLIISAQTGKPQVAENDIDSLMALIIHRHSEMYLQAQQLYQEDVPDEDSPVLMIDSYTYPTKVLNQAVSSRNSKDWIKKSVIAFMAGLFFGVMLVFLRHAWQQYQQQKRQ